MKLVDSDISDLKSIDALQETCQELEVEADTHTCQTLIGQCVAMKRRNEGKKEDMKKLE